MGWAKPHIGGGPGPIYLTHFPLFMSLVLRLVTVVG
jgi:hypothetical protein